MNTPQVRFSRPWGAHISIAGGVEKAPARGHAVGAAALQIFTKNNTRWLGPPIKADQAAEFQRQSARWSVSAMASHVCYLVNLASPKKVILEKSRLAFLDEMDRAELLEIPFLVFHPGAHMGAGEEDGLKLAGESLLWAMDQRPGSKVILTLETTAGQGTSLGSSFGHLARIIRLAGESTRLGICVDTCHIFAGGYPIADKVGYQGVFRELDSELGLSRVRLFHLNDSKKPEGSRVDRHEHIGRGFIGLEGFRLLVNDPRFVKTPMILETPKGEDGLDDARNLKVLRELIEGE